MGRLLINDFKGLNSSIASLQLKPGEFQSSQNLRGRPYTNFARRNGVEASAIQTSPVLGIFELDLDGVIIPLIQTDKLEFNADISSESLPYSGDIYSSDDPLDKGGSKLFIFNVEQTMRAINDRRVVAGLSPTVWPTIIWKSDGSQYGSPQSVGTYPVNNIYGPDLAYDDTATGHAIGTKAAQLVNAIIAACISTVNFASWIKTISGSSSIILYDSTIFPSAGSATKATYRTKLSLAQIGLRKLTTLQAQGSQVNVESKTGTASDTPTGCYTSVSISGYSDSFFNVSGCVVDALLGTPWDGVFPFGSSGASGDCAYIWTFDGTTSINGKILSAAYLYSYNDDNYFGATDEITIVSSHSPGPSLVSVWVGEKPSASGGDAKGVYSRSAGCSATPATITIV